MNNIFDPATTAELTARIHELTPETRPLWGTMSAGQMLAHCNVSYEMVYEEGKHAKPNAFLKAILMLVVKKHVVNEKPFKHNVRTAPQFIIKGDKDFAAEKARLIGHIVKTQELGGDHFNGRLSHSFGALTTAEWNNMFYKHLDHHLSQFGV